MASNTPGDFSEQALRGGRDDAVKLTGIDVCRSNFVSGRNSPWQFGWQSPNMNGSKVSWEFLVPGKWMRIDLDQERVSAGLIQSIQKSCLDRFVEAGMPQPAGMYARKPDTVERRRRIYTELFFSPTMSHLAREVMAVNNAVTCAAPPARGTHILIGGEPAAELLA